ncbi:MAG: hypothetical protein WHS90_08365 [Caldilinea sp.]|jgi:hypothetical protein|uniref:hypothetical protein n=1 Tax=Caldilinea sp. TaxID=2293560 RepID=UPI0030AA22C3
MATIVSVAALLLALLALAYAWKLQRELDAARGRLDRYNRALFKVEESMRTLREQLEETTVRLRVELLQRTGDARFTPEMTVREALLLHPQAQQILAGFHLGGCSSCAVEPDATLAALCASRGVDAAELLANLNQLLGAREDHNGLGPFQRVKVPNVHLEIE